MSNNYGAAVFEKLL